MIEAVGRAVSIETETIIANRILSRRSSRLYRKNYYMETKMDRVACKIGMRLLAPKTKQSYLFLAPLGSGLGKVVVAIYPGRAMQRDALAFLPHPTDITVIAPPSTTRLRSLGSAGLLGGSDQRRIRGCGPDGCLLGRIYFPCGYVCLWYMCFCVAEVFFLFSHCTPQGA